MSGIAGIIHFNGTPVAPGLVEKMTDAMNHRGPDGIHHWINGSVALGQCMLHTTSESLIESQPLTNENVSLVLVMDGRVDNWKELRKELLSKGVILRDRSDAELVLRSYEVWREDCLNQIDGDFSIVIWDGLKQKVFCARDKIGNKPFYYHCDGNTFVFSSELHTILLLPWVKEELNMGMVAEHLAFELYSRNETLWVGIMRLVAAHSMEVWRGSLKKTQYWSPDLWATLPYKKEEEFVEHYRYLFSETMRNMSRSHETLSCEVSGGLDSSAIFAMAEHLCKQQKLNAPSIKAYTLNFRNQIAANELDFAHAAGRYLGKEIHEVLPSNQSISWYAKWAEKYRCLPPHPNGAMGLGIRNEAASMGSRVLMTGVGGDEWLWGNRGYYADLIATAEWGDLYNCLKIDAKDAGLIQTIRWLARHGLVEFLPDFAKTNLRKALRKFDSKKNWLAPSLKKTMQERRMEYFETIKSDGMRVGYQSHFNTLNSAFAVHICESEEQLAASAGIELRRPFWSHKMVQLAFSIPMQWRLQGTTDRVIHRKAMKDLLPKKILQRNTKANFMTTYQKPINELYNDLNKRSSLERSSWVNNKEVKALWKQCNKVDKGGWPEYKLFTLFGCDSIVKKI